MLPCVAAAARMWTRSQPQRARSRSLVFRPEFSHSPSHTHTCSLPLSYRQHHHHHSLTPPLLTFEGAATTSSTSLELPNTCASRSSLQRPVPTPSLHNVSSALCIRKGSNPASKSTDSGVGYFIRLRLRLNCELIRLRLRHPQARRQWQCLGSP